MLVQQAIYPLCHLPSPQVGILKLVLLTSTCLWDGLECSYCIAGLLCSQHSRRWFPIQEKCVVFGFVNLKMISWLNYLRSTFPSAYKNPILIFFANWIVVDSPWHCSTEPQGPFHLKLFQHQLTQAEKPTFQRQYKDEQIGTCYQQWCQARHWPMGVCYQQWCHARHWPMVSTFDMEEPDTLKRLLCCGAALY